MNKVGTLTLNTDNATSYSFVQSTGVQFYTFQNIDWSLILGRTDKPSKKYLVEHDFVPSSIPSSGLYTNYLPAAPVVFTYPFWTSILISCSFFGNSSATAPPGTFTNVINTINCKYLEYFPGNTQAYTFPVQPFCHKQLFTVTNPGINSTVTIATCPSDGNATYQYQFSPALFTQPILSYPNDYYTRGIHIFKFVGLEDLVVT